MFPMIHPHAPQPPRNPQPGAHPAGPDPDIQGDRRVALIHYWLVGMRGGEKVLEQLCAMFPRADIFTHVVDPARLSPVITRHRIVQTRVGHLPFARRLYPAYLPLMPRALEEIDLSGYDLVISSEAGPAKGVIAPPDAPHLCYCHSPMRYLWDQYPAYRAGAGGLARLVMPHLAHRLRQWDVTSAARVDRIVANSGFVAARIRKYWRREAAVIHPPVAVQGFAPVPAAERGDFYLWCGELAPYKRPDLAIAAMARSGRRLVVIGGPERRVAQLRASAPPGVHFLGKLPDAELRALMARCRALIFPGEEDFGITPVEAMAAGRPVIAYGRGGVRDTVIAGETGLFFDTQSVEALIEALERFEASGLEHGAVQACTRRARAFTEGVFRRRMAEELARLEAGPAPQSTGGMAAGAMAAGGMAAPDGSARGGGGTQQGGGADMTTAQNGPKPGLRPVTAGPGAGGAPRAAQVQPLRPEAAQVSPAQTRSVEARSIEARSIEAKSVAAQPVPPKPAPAAPQSAQARPVAPQPASSPKPRPVSPPVGRARLRPRHKGIAASFVLIVLLPVSLASAYLAVRAQDRYVSHVGFSVRSENTSSAMEMLGGIAEISGSSSSDTDILYNFIRSEEMVRALDARLDLRAMWSRPGSGWAERGSDPVHAYHPPGTIEDLTRYWGRRVRVHSDSGTGLIDVEAQAFTAAEAHLLTQAIFEESSAMINRLSQIAREDKIRYARIELEAAIERLKTAREAMTRFRNENQIVDPQSLIEGQVGLLSSLHEQLAQSFIELDTLRQTTRPDDPRIARTERRVEVISDRIAQERGKLGLAAEPAGGAQGGAQGPGTPTATTTAYADIIGEYERLAVDREFAEESYRAALTAYDTAQAEALRQSRYLAAHIRPSMPEASTAPRRGRDIAFLALITMMLWVLAVLVAYALRDRR